MHKQKLRQSHAKDANEENRQVNDARFNMKRIEVVTDPGVKVGADKLSALAELTEKVRSIFISKFEVSKDALSYLKRIRIEKDTYKDDLTGTEKAREYNLFVTGGELRIAENVLDMWSDEYSPTIAHELTHAIVFGNIPGSEAIRHNNWNTLYEEGNGTARLIRASDEALATFSGSVIGAYEFGLLAEMKTDSVEYIATANKKFEEFMKKKDNERKRLYAEDRVKAMFMINEIGYVTGRAAFLRALDFTVAKQYDMLKKLLSANAIISESGDGQDMRKVLGTIFRFAEESGRIGEGFARFVNEELSEVSLVIKGSAL